MFAKDLSQRAADGQVDNTGLDGSKVWKHKAADNAHSIVKSILCKIRDLLHRFRSISAVIVLIETLIVLNPIS